MRLIRHPQQLASMPAVGRGVRHDGQSAAAGLRHEVVVLAGTFAADSPVPVTQCLCIRSMRSGIEDCALHRRRVSIDADAYLIVNAGQECVASYRAGSEVSPFAVFFAPEWIAHAGLAGLDFLETLRPHGDGVSRCLQSLATRIDAAETDAFWCEEQLNLLLGAAIAADGDLRGIATRIACVKASTRQELLRRVLLAADFIQSHYDQPITLADIAAAARLSRFHLVRLFRQALATTPHAYLRDKRLAVAGRLLAGSRCDLSEIAERSGIGTRSSLFRHLQRRLGASGRTLRKRIELSVPLPTPTASGAETCRIPA